MKKTILLIASVLIAAEAPKATPPVSTPATATTNAPPAKITKAAAIALKAIFEKLTELDKQRGPLIADQNTVANEECERAKIPVKVCQIQPNGDILAVSREDPPVTAKAEVKP